MRVRTKRFELRLSYEELAALEELARLLGVNKDEAIRRAVAEKLKRVRAKQKPTDQTEAA